MATLTITAVAANSFPPLNTQTVQFSSISSGNSISVSASSPVLKGVWVVDITRSARFTRSAFPYLSASSSAMVQSIFNGLSLVLAVSDSPSSTVWFFNTTVMPLPSAHPIAPSLPGTVSPSVLSFSPTPFASSTALSGFNFSCADNFVGTATVLVSVRNEMGTVIDTSGVSITCTSINHRPAIVYANGNGNDAITIGYTTLYSLSSITVTDPIDSLYFPSAAVKLSVALTDGAISLPSASVPSSLLSLTQSDKLIEAIGSIASLNSLLSAVSISPNSANPQLLSLTVVVNDLGNGGLPAYSSAQSFRIVPSCSVDPSPSSFSQYQINRMGSKTRREKARQRQGKE